MRLLQLNCFIVFFHYVWSFDHVITCPKAFRLGADEKVVLDLYGYDNGATVEFFLQDLPDMENFFNVIEMDLNADEASKPVWLNISVQPRNIPEFEIIQRVLLTIVVTNSQGGDFNKALQVLISQESGYIFVTTNQPVYKPTDFVLIKAFTLNQTMEPDPTKVKFVVKTPDGIGTSTQTDMLDMRNQRFASASYQINPNAVFGLWSVEATYLYKGYETTSEAKFLVDRYVLPTFQVSVEMVKNFILPNDADVGGNVRAIYSYGEVVHGSLYLSMKVKVNSSVDRAFAIEFYSVPPPGSFSADINNGNYAFGGRAVANLIETLRNKTGDTLQSVQENGGSVFVEATVTESGSGYLESDVTPDIPIISSPYTVDTTRTSLYFTPSLVFTLRADLLFTIGRNPAPGVAYEVLVNNTREAQGRTGDRGQINIDLNFANSNAQTIILRIQDMQETITIQPYSSPSNNYLQIEPSENQVWNVGDNFRLRFRYNYDRVSQIRFFVVARGTIVYANVTEPIPGNSESSEDFPIIANMVPSARIVAYYLVGTEIVSNSLWFDVKDQCKTELTINLAEEQIEPGAAVTVNLEGPPHALVGVSGVDRAAYFLYNGSRLTRDEMFGKMGSYDQGCVRNGGRDGPGVFLEAGLTVASSVYEQQVVFSINCSDTFTGRKKRQAPEVTAPTDFSQDKYLALRLEKCKMSGKFQSFLAEESCSARVERCMLFNRDVPDCCEEFGKICEEEDRGRLLALLFGLIGRSSSGAGAIANSVQRARRFFNQQISFENIQLDNQGRFTHRTSSSDSITTYEFDAASVASTTDGFCIAETKELRIFRNVFIQVYTPFALKIHEQTNLRIVVFNYGEEDTTVSLQVRPRDDNILCTHFEPGEWTAMTRRQTVASHRSISTTLSVLPLRLGNGDTTIEFRVLDKDDNALDIIQKTLLVEESGQILDTTGSEPIDLTIRNEQTFQVEFRFPENFVSGTRKCWLYVHSDFMGPTIEVDEVTQEPQNIDRIFRKPTGCGEQTIAAAGPNTYAHMYLESTGKLRPNTPEYEQSLAHMREGYNRELGHRSNRVNQRAWAKYNHYAPSTWLNAFVDKVFMKANMYENTVDIAPMCTSLEWLLTQQQPDGHFQDLQPPHRYYRGFLGDGSPEALAAYVVIAFLETQSRCSPAIQMNIATGAQNAVEFLLRNQDAETFQKPYGIVLLSYTLALHQPTSQVTARTIDRLLDLRNSSNGKVYWEAVSRAEVEGVDAQAYWYFKSFPLAINVETTAYALLALVEREKRVHNPPRPEILEITRQTVLWLIAQRNDAGAFRTTQDTVIGLQALATYQIWVDEYVPKQPTNFSVHFSSPVNTTWEDIEPQFPEMTDANSRFKHELVVPDDVISFQGVTVTARGNGEGMVSHRCIYRTEMEEEPCHFNLSETVEILNELDVENGDANRKIKFTLSVQAIRNDAGMSIIEVGLMTGFVPILDTIERLSQELAADGVIQRYEITNVTIIFYVDFINVTEPLVLAFEMEQRIPVSQPQPARIHVFNYYEPGMQCGKFYTLPNQRPNILTSNCGADSNNEQFCKCAEGGCLKCRTRHDQQNDSVCLYGNSRKDCLLCEGRKCPNMVTEGCQRNYAYEITVTSVSPPFDGSQFYTFKSTISRVIREGSLGDLGKDSKASFIVRRDCFEECMDDNLDPPDKSNNEFSNIIRRNQRLLVMGRPEERIVEKSGTIIHQYRLDDTAIIERLYPRDKCEKRKAAWKKNKCRKLPDDADPALRDKCIKQEKYFRACNNYDRIVERLAQGCS